MNKDIEEFNQRLKELRQKAKLQSDTNNEDETKKTVSISLELLHDLRVNKIDLELQNKELQQAHAALQQSRAHYVELYDYAPVGYLTLNNDGIITEINLTAANLLGMEREQILEKNFENFIDDIHKELWHRHFIHAKSLGATHGCELPFQRNNDAIFYFHIDCLYIDQGSVPPYMRITLSDISRRKQAEEELRIAAVAFNTQSGIIITDSNEVIVRVNEAFSRITGYNASEVIGKTPAMLHSGLQDQSFYQSLWAKIGNLGHWEGELWDKHKNGDLFPVWQSITAVKDPDGNITHYVGSFTDITAHKKAEMVLLDARNRLQSQVLCTQEDLERHKKETAEVNTALSIVLKHQELDKTNTQVALTNEINATVMPLLKSLKGLAGRQDESVRLLTILEANLELLMKSYGRAANLSAAYQKLTPIEIQVASMIRQGRPTKVIAQALNIAAGTVSIHRKHIRKKFGLDGKSDNLSVYLQSLTE